MHPQQLVIKLQREEPLPETPVRVVFRCEDGTRLTGIIERITKIRPPAGRAYYEFLVGEE